MAYLQCETCRRVPRGSVRVVATGDGANYGDAVARVEEVVKWRIGEVRLTAVTSGGVRVDVISTPHAARVMADWLVAGADSAAELERKHDGPTAEIE